MDLGDLRIGLVEQEAFAPDLDAVRERVRLATGTDDERPAHRARPRRILPVAAAIAAVGLLALFITIARHRSNPDVSAPPTSMVAGTHWRLTAATVAGLPDYGVQPDLIESLYLYPDGTSVTTGLCFTRQGNWQERGNDLVFTGQRTLQHPCPLDMQDTAPQRALLSLDGPMEFTVDATALHLDNSTTSMTLEAAGAAPTNPQPSIGAPVDPALKSLVDVTWQLTAAVQKGKDVALPVAKPTTIALYADGTSTMVAPACFYQTGRWHPASGGAIEFTDQVRPVMGCYAVSDEKEEAGGTVLAAMTGPVDATVDGGTLTLKGGDTVATFTVAEPAPSHSTPSSAPTTSR